MYMLQMLLVYRGFKNSFRHNYAKFFVLDKNLQDQLVCKFLEAFFYPVRVQMAVPKVLNTHASPQPLTFA